MSTERETTVEKPSLVIPNALKAKVFDDYNPRTVREATALAVFNALAGLPLKDIPPQVANECVRSFEDMGGVWIFGENGTGKTHLMAALYNHITTCNWMKRGEKKFGSLLQKLLILVLLTGTL